MNKILLYSLCVLFFISSCENKKVSFPDFDYQTVYFGSQYPVRTIELGEDPSIDNSLDNQHKFSIKATLGGTQDNKNTVEIGFVVDESLITNAYFASSGNKILPMPPSYYQLLSKDKIIINPHDILGGVEVQLTDEFFSDPLSVQNTYAIPLVMTSVSGADSILSGNPSVDNPFRLNGADWVSVPLDFTVFVVKYVNQYNGNYLRRGKDVVTYQGGTNPVNITRHREYVESDEINEITTKSLTESILSMSIKDKDGNNIPFTILLTFDKDDHCTVSSLTNGVTISGTGAFVKRGEKKSWGNEDRDAIYLDYQISMNQLTANTLDTLVLRDRAVSPEYFSPLLK